MTSMSQWLLPWNLLVYGLNAAVASLVACGIALILSRRSSWSLPARHTLLAVALAASLTVPLLVPRLHLPSLWTINIAATVHEQPPEFVAPPSTNSHSELYIEPLTSNMEAAVETVSKLSNGVAPSVIVPDVSISESTAPTSISQQPATTSSWAHMIGTLLCGLWFAGTGIGLARAIFDLARLRRWLHSVSVADSQQLTDIARLAANNVGLQTPAMIYCSSFLPAPITLGLLRPRIVLPKDIEASLPADQLRAVIQHEMAHIVRRDLWIGLLQQTVLIAYWWNPLVRLVSRRLANLREQICDDIAIRELPEPSSYAATLISLAERCSRSVPLPATLGIGSSLASQLEHRIRRVLSSSPSRNVRLTRMAAVSVLVTSVLMTATILLAQIQVNSSDNSKANEQSKPAAPVVTSPGSRKSPPAVEQPQAAVSKPAVVEEPDPFEHPEWGTVEIPGRVVGPDGKPVAGATIFVRKFGVRIPSKKATTDADGRFKFISFRRNGPKLSAANPNPIVTKKTLPGGIAVTITESVF